MVFPVETLIHWQTSSHQIMLHCSRWEGIVGSPASYTGSIGKPRALCSSRKRQPLSKGYGSSFAEKKLERIIGRLFGDPPTRRVISIYRWRMTRAIDVGCARSRNQTEQKINEFVGYRHGNRRDASNSSSFGRHRSSDRRRRALWCGSIKYVRDAAPFFACLPVGILPSRRRPHRHGRSGIAW